MRGLKALPLLVLAALVWFLFFSEIGAHWLAGRFTRDTSVGPTVGRVLSSTGSFKRVRNGHVEDYQVAPAGALEIADGDRLETDKSSSLVMVLNSQDELLLPELSAVAVKIWNPADPASPLYIELHAGTVNATKTGVRGRAYVVKDGKLYFPGQKTEGKPLALTVTRSGALGDLELADSGETGASATGFEPDTTVEAPEESKETSLVDSPDTLSNEYIDEMIASRQSQLQKCWLSRLKENANLRGQIILQFEITRRGKVRDLRVAESTINDDTLKRCVMTVFERISFQPFKGAEISLSYPINFE